MAALSSAERLIVTVVSTVMQFTMSRFPMVAVSILYLTILVAAPGQLTHIVANFSTEATFLQWMTFMVPPALASAGLVALLQSHPPLRRSDVVLACVPSFALCAMAAIWAPRLLLVGLPSLLLTMVGATAMRQFARRDSRKAYKIVIRSTFACFAAVLIATLLSPIGFPVTIGPMTVMTLGLSFIGLFLGIATLHPGLAGAYFVTCLLAATLSPGNRPVPLFEPEVVPLRNAPSAGAAFEAWLKSRPDLGAYKKAGRPYPVIIASAEGGGIYAAAHAYLALSAMQAICPSFPVHLFATVGVSGGSIGTLLYSATTASRSETGDLVNCQSPGSIDQAIDTRPLATDLISPPLANLLFAQVADFLVPFVHVFPDSGEILAKAIAGMAPGNSHMSEPLRASWNPSASRPVTLFVTTDVSEGNRVVISPLDGAGAIGAASFPSGSITSPRDIASNEAAFISARFPWLTATARLQVSDNSFRILADGGYYENSGADTAMDLIAQIRELARLHAECAKGKPVLGDLGSCSCPVRMETSFRSSANWVGCGIPVFLAFMPISEAREGLPGYTYEDTPDPSQSWLGDPLTTMLQARSARGVLAIDRARAAFASPQDREMAQGSDVDNGFFPHVLPVSDLRLPVGWLLSPASVADMLAISANLEACGKEHDSNSSIATWTAGNGCRMKMLATLFNPAEVPRALGIKAHGRD
ncbi:hypothetical protein [Rhizobium leguminosarum]|uniref:hypothetical protein n=1 Tax=Rhizobium leguminosarum TaxID=384 RepID=UPI001C93D9E6|nr:hypothetical protein [Rhizobium leguminosarum]MBY5376654.1 hypothetical protein [Rhizobium leguminosarum]